MNTLLHRNKNGSDDGFTLIEVLVVIIIIGILASIALPAYLNQANRAREAEAKSYIGSINRAQQAHYLEKSFFAGSIEDLEIGIPLETQNYRYSLQANEFEAIALADPINALNPYSGIIWLETEVGNDRTTLSRICNKVFVPSRDCT